MTTPILYTFRRCPYAMRARLALASAGILVEIREILLRDKPAELIKASEKATVPVIVTADKIIDESRDIMIWALARNDPEGWHESNDTALIDECETTFKNALDKYKYTQRHDEFNRGQNRSIAANFLKRLDHILARQEYLSGEKSGFSDMAIITFVRQFAFVDRIWFESQSWPNLITWLNNFLDSDQFAFIMQKYPVWNAGSSPIYFPEKS